MLSTPRRTAPRRTRRRGSGLLLCLIALVVPWAARAQDGPASPARTDTLEAGRMEAEDPTLPPWREIVPPPESGFDWIQLTSDEWLKGEFVALHNFQVTFDSDELGLQTFDWEDIRRVRTAGPKAVRLEDPQEDRPLTLHGILTVEDSRAYLGRELKGRSFERDRIVAIAVGTGREVDRWRGELSLGVNLRSGNADLADATLSASVTRRQAVSRLNADFLGNYSWAEGEETSNNDRLGVSFDLFASSRLFWRPLAAEYYRDPFKNIDHQISAGAGAGHYLTHTTDTDWEVTAGAGILYKRSVSVEPGQDSETISAAFTLGTRLDTSLRSWLDYLLDFRFQILDKQTGRYTHHLITTLSSDLFSNLDTDISFIWDRVQNPRPSADGVVPDRDDFQILFAVSYEL